MSDTQNDLIARLPDDERSALLAHCEPVDLVLSEVLCQRGQPLRHAYFPVDGFVSMLAQLEGHPDLEVAMVGREGMLGSHLVLGVARSPLLALVQGAGACWRIEAMALTELLPRCPVLHAHLQRFIALQMDQLAASAACAHAHEIAARLARWLLMSHDRAHADAFRMTHAFIASMLGVRRVGITGAASGLQRQGFIRYHRGALTVLDRAGLESAACSCYAADQRAAVVLMVPAEPALT